VTGERVGERTEGPHGRCRHRTAGILKRPGPGRRRTWPTQRSGCSFGKDP
jgi:hypothetical protein